LTSGVVIDTMGYIYFGSQDSNFYKLDPSTGMQVWNFNAGEEIEGSPAIWNDRVIFGCDSDILYALSLSTGALLWNFTAQDDIEAGIVIGGPNWDTAYFGDDENYVYGVSAATGAQMWTYQTGDDIHSAPAVSNDGTVVYAGSTDNSLYAINSVTGAVIWKQAMQGSIQSSPVVDASGNIYVGDNNGYYTKLTSAGAITWQMQPSGDDQNIESSGCLSAKGDVIYIGSDDYNVYALSTASGATLWTAATQGNVESALILDAMGTLYVGSNDDNVYAFNSMTGAQYWNFTTGEEVYFTAISPYGQLIVTSEDDKVYALTT